MWLHLQPFKNLLLTCIILNLSSGRRKITSCSLFPPCKGHLAPALTCPRLTDLCSGSLGEGAVQWWGQEVSFYAMRWESLENVLLWSSQCMKTETEHTNVNKNRFNKCTNLYRFVIKQHQKEGRLVTNTN